MSRWRLKSVCCAQEDLGIVWQSKLQIHFERSTQNPRGGRHDDHEMCAMTHQRVDDDNVKLAFLDSYSLKVVCSD